MERHLAHTLFCVSRRDINVMNIKLGILESFMINCLLKYIYNDKRASEDRRKTQYLFLLKRSQSWS